MDKDVLVHIYNGILLSHKKNAFVSGLIRWMNLEPIIQSEVSQKENDKEAMVHNNGILLSHEKEHIWISSNEVNEPRAYYTEWSKS